MRVGDLVKHYDQLYAGLGIVVRIDVPDHRDVPRRDAVDFARVQYSDVVDWIPVTDLEIVNESR